MTTPHSSEVLLKLAFGEVTYAGGVVAMRGINLEVRRGEFLVLLGPSGAGKSTLLRSLNGLVPLSSGTLAAGQAGLVDSPRALRAHRRRTAFVFQQHHLIGRLTALDNVLTGRLAFHAAWRTLLPMPRADRLIALDALARVGLLEYALQRADRLSGGQQQRVGIARALAQQPVVLLADEPVASLDPATALRVLELVHRICKDAGIAAVVSLHQVDLAKRFADRIIGVSGGRVVFDDVPARLDADALHAVYGAATDATTFRPPVQPSAIADGEPALVL